jgi:molybdopterin-binding protein
VRGVSARAGAFRLHDVSFTVPAGGWGVVLGPVGAGKTTLLEAIAGLLPLHAGTVHLAGRDVSRLPPEQRGLALVYQHAFLFPHLTVRQNVAYGAADAALAREVAERVGAWALRDQAVGALSGGERQLVALARALACRPRVLLLDEPWSALDPARRVRVRREVRRLHDEWGLTTLTVTHDFAEAGGLAGVAVLLDGGRVLQTGAPEALFRSPATARAAGFLGVENVLAVEVVGAAGDPPGEEPADRGAVPAGPGEPRVLELRAGPLVLHAVGDAPPGPAHAVIRAEEVVLSCERPAGSARNRFQGVVQEVAVHGPLATVTVDVGGTPFVAALTRRSAQEMGLGEGRGVWVSFKAHGVGVVG